MASIDNCSSKARYRRILVKLSGEALSSGGRDVLNHDIVFQICREIKNVADMGVQVGIVVGGGNIWRGRQGVNGSNPRRSYGDARDHDKRAGARRQL